MSSSSIHCFNNPTYVMAVPLVEIRDRGHFVLRLVPVGPDAPPVKTGQLASSSLFDIYAPSSEKSTEWQS